MFEDKIIRTAFYDGDIKITAILLVSIKSKRQSKEWEIANGIYLCAEQIDAGGNLPEDHDYYTKQINIPCRATNVEILMDSYEHKNSITISAAALVRIAKEIEQIEAEGNFQMTAHEYFEWQYC